MPSAHNNSTKVRYLLDILKAHTMQRSLNPSPVMHTDLVNWLEGNGLREKVMTFQVEGSYCCQPYSLLDLASLSLQMGSKKTKPMT